MTAKVISKRLDRYLKIASAIFLVAGVSAIISAKFDIPSYFSACTRPYVAFSYMTCATDAIQRLFAAHSYALILGGLTFGWYFLYRTAVEGEKKMLDGILNALTDDREPQKLSDERMIIALAFGIPIIFLALAWTVDRIAIYSFIVLLLNLFDLTGNVIIRENLDCLLRTAERTAAKDSTYNYYRAKRKVAEWYWIQLPQLRRICTLTFLNLVALFIAVQSSVGSDLNMDKRYSYFLIGIGIISNELVMFYWRSLRDRKLEKIGYLESRATRMNRN